MNLTTDPWIPIVRTDGKPGKVSLHDAFARGHEVRDLVCRPHERIALMRLLICVAQAALDGPEDREDWTACRNRMRDSVADYLRKWHGGFELFGDGPRFLQVEGVTPTKSKGADNAADVAKLNLDLAAGNVSTLFDNHGGSDRGFAPADLALMLLTFQCLSPGGLLSECYWSGSRTKKSGNKVAPCLSDRMLHTFVLDRDCLRNQIWRNLLPRELLRGLKWGKPVWEQMPRSAGDAEAVANALETYLGRLVPLSRAVRLLDDRRSVVWGSGLEYPPFSETEWRDPFATVHVRQRGGKPERSLLGVSPDRAIWRQLHSVTVLAKADGAGALGGPLALTQNATQGAACDIWSGGLADKQKAKIVEAIEAVFHVPAGMFEKDGRVLYQCGVELAANREAQLKRAIATYRRALDDELERKETWKRGNLVKQKGTTHYWTTIEQHVPDLLAVVEHPEMLGSDPTRPQWHTTGWGRAMYRVVRNAYDLACPHGTPRQYKAYALGLEQLFAEPPQEETADERNPKRETEE